MEQTRMNYLSASPRAMDTLAAWSRPLGRCLSVVIVAMLVACGSRPSDVKKLDVLPGIFPDYVDVTIPVDIAPLDFNFADEHISRMDVVVRGSKAGELHTSGEWAEFPVEAWHELTRQNQGGDLVVTVCVEKNSEWFQYRDFTIHVSPYRLDDFGLTYRRIAPGYEVGGNIGIYQRDIHTFTEQPLITETLLPGRCFNCHTPNRGNPAQLTLQIRGEGGGTLIQKEGSQQWLNTKTDSTKAACSYAYWHPGGRYCAYAVNAVHQAFFVGRDRRIEAYHDFGDVLVLDSETNELLVSPLLQTSYVEIFPSFSADGKTLYYSTSAPCRVPAEYEKVKCSLCAIGFDAQTGQFASAVDTLLNSRLTDKSYVLARPSYDGRWLMYCQVDCGNFPVNHRESDLWLMDLKTRTTRCLSEVNSIESESFHNWSSNSRWFVFSSRRLDGMYHRLFLASVDDEGHATKPFLLPQRNPRKFYGELMDAYNVPDFTTVAVSLDAHEVHRQVWAADRVPVTVR